MSAAAALAEAPAPAASSDDDREQRMKWWHQARFGMFIHWGLYSAVGRHEWVMENEAIPVAEYEQLAQHFTPKPNAARAWAKLARQAGQKYMVMTTKHHEGFCLFDSKLTNYSRAETGLRPRPGEGIRRRGAGGGIAGRILLFADGLASSRRRAVRGRRSGAAALRRLHPRPSARAVHATTASWTCFGTT